METAIAEVKVKVQYYLCKKILFVNFFGNNLRVLRLRAGRTQEEMEQLLGIGKNTWSNYENSRSQPGIEGLIQISNFFGVTLDTLIVEKLDDEKHVPKKPKPYSKVVRATKVKENGFEYLLKKVERMEKDLDSMKKSQGGKNQSR